MESQIVQCDLVKLKVSCWKPKSEDALPLLALHGFTGDGLDFKPLAEETADIFHWHAPDLIGHGKSDAPESENCFSISNQVAQIHEIEKALGLKDYILMGYSMGGRLALHYALAHPTQLKALILIGANPGIANTEERQQRYDNDLLLADKIKNDGVAQFIKDWQETDIIASQKNISEPIHQEMLKRRHKNNTIGLINSLKGFSNGITPSLWEDLPRIKCPTSIITGSLDGKYCEIAKKMVLKIKGAKHEVIPNSGHSAHLENIPYFCKTLNTRHHQ